ncbi:hypothetical protein V6N13_080727 [Hibiscus sabdariffa]|uniref:Uncharacterized protein n=1 Tax=Hibiscus sabdariffa TaxID=183260 RepID=A0ABR2CB35_9ROSI
MRNLDEATHLSKEDLSAWGEAMCAFGKVVVGTMVVFSNLEVMMDPLNSWGLEDIKVKHIGGYQYLTEIRDMELSRCLKICNGPI